uniref:Macro domain-containing protein n=1 Tax=Poecilia latipinna TaxID=48699 RepID=A0A3B3W0X7_9TELE
MCFVLLSPEYVTGDLFSAPDQESLAHCVSEDLRMGKGIAVLFKKNFGRVDALKEQSKFFNFCGKMYNAVFLR